MDKQTRSSKKGLTVGLTAGLLGGAAAGMVLGVPGLSSAAESDIEPVAIVQQVDDTVAPSDVAPDERPDPGTRLRDVLQPLVDDSTLTAVQADAVADHLVANRPDRPDRGDRGDRRGHGPGGRFGRLGGGAASEAVTDLLGIDQEAIVEQLRAGSPLADIANANGVDTDTLVDTLVAEAQARIDAAIEAGNVEADQVADRLANLEEQITARVNGERPEHGPRGQAVDAEN